jgi:crotonobetainyl-CoA:carnitine CoA-transferase CaiB-like acyl-CoA transferase
MVQRVEHPTEGPIDLLGPVAKFSRTPADIRLAPPPLGHDTRAILRDLLDYAPEEIDRLYAAGAI